MFSNTRDVRDDTASHFKLTAEEKDKTMKVNDSLIDKFMEYAEKTLKKPSLNDEELQSCQAKRDLIEKVRKRLQSKVSEFNNRLAASSNQDKPSNVQ